MSTGDPSYGRDILDPYLYTTGPRDCGVVLIVGEAWGSEELQQRRPFVGYSGKELDRILFDAGLNRADILCANLVDSHPQSNDFTNFLKPNARREGYNLRGASAGELLVQGHKKLLALIDRTRPRLIIGCGNWPLWALTGHARLSTVKGFKLPSGIMNWRGSQTFTDEINGTKYPYLPIIHPAAILRDWGLRNVTCQDLRARAKRFISGSISWTPPSEHFDYAGSYEAAWDFLRCTLARADSLERAGGSLWLAVDVETWRRRYLAVVGICDGNRAIAIPFFYFEAGSGLMVDCFNLEQEVEIQRLLRALLHHPAIRITNQNYAYDWQYLHRYLGIHAEPAFDTMLAHHLLWPGTPKGLDYLASLYCNHYCYWKDESQDWDAKSNHMDMWRYNCKDTTYTYEITEVLKDLLAKANLQETYQFQMDQWSLANEMQTRGIKWDTRAARIMREELVQTADSLSGWLMRAMPEDLQYAPSGKPWFSSNPHLQYIFYDRLGIPPILHKKTKKPTLDKESFEQLKKKTPWIGPILDKLKLLRSVQVFRDNFLSKSLGPDGRMHPSFNVGGTETFRWSSSENPFGEGMNLQNIPRLDDE